MKRFCFFLLAIALCGYSVLLAQPKTAKYIIDPARLKNLDKTVTLDTAGLRVSYALNADDLADPHTYIDLQCLEIGNRVAKYYSRFLSDKEQRVDAWIKERPSAQSVPHWLGEGGKRQDCWSEYQYSEIFKEGDIITVYSRMPHGLGRYDCWHKEPYPLQQWTVQPDTLTICGQLCQKAVCHFRGRSFEAWFAPGIPVGMGPWKFGGLPGLILKVQDADRLYTFECVGVELGKFPIRKYDYSRYREMDRKQLLKLQRRINEDYFRVAHVRDTNTGKPLSFYQAYEPLELE